MRQAGLPLKRIAGGKYRRLPHTRWYQQLAHPGMVLLNLRDLFLIAIGTLQALYLLLRLKPDVIFNKAGTTGLPVGLAAHWLRIPMVIHEPDVVPGMANRILSKWASAIAVGFPTSHYRSLPQAKLVYTGNPVQPEVTPGDRAAARKALGFSSKRPLLLVVGGSQGAQAINQAIGERLRDYLKTTQVYQVSGKGGEAMAQASAEAANAHADTGYRLAPFLPIKEMVVAYRAADVVIARAGASTIAELAALSKPTVLVPNQQAAAHQIVNAQVVTAAHAAVLGTENPTQLYKLTTSLLGDSARQQRLAKAISGFALPDAATHIAAVIRQAAERHA